MSSTVGNVASQPPVASQVLAYISAEKAPLYRAIMRVFIESKERFIFHLSLQQVFDGVRAADHLAATEQNEVETALAELCGWGNLETLPDTAGVCIVEDFYKPRHTFQMASPGEAAERALEHLAAAPEGQEGELQYPGLRDIGLALQELRQLCRQAEPDAGKIHRNLVVCRALFEDLSAAAVMFIGRLERGIDLQPHEARRLIDYGHRFIGELILETDSIGETVRDIEAAGLERLFQVLGEPGVRSTWRSHWGRFRNWFISEPGRRSNSETLRERARASMPVLLRMMTNINDQQIHRIDRAMDFRVLARWFAQAASDAEAHLLWRAAFGLCPARHLTIDDAMLDAREAQDVPAGTSWLDAPVRSSSLRDYRSNSRTGGLSRIIDRRAEKEKLAAANREEAERLLNAHRRFGTGSRILLSQLDHLETYEFELLLNLLGEAVSARVFPSEAVEIVSGDGCLRLKLEPTGDGREALISVAEGMFSGPDYWISVERISGEEVPLPS